MKLALISFTEKGGALAGTLQAALQGRHSCTRFAFDRDLVPGAQPFHSGTELVAQLFSSYEGLIFVCACGIAVRLIAPFVASKTADPAVLVADDSGRFVISLLSGHIGGANKLAQEAAKAVEAVPVITTATDSGGIFSPDSFAVENGLCISDMDKAKELAVRLLRGERLGFCSPYPCTRLLEETFSIVPYETEEEGRVWGRGEREENGEKVICGSDQSGGKITAGICVSPEESDRPFPITLHLKPKPLVVGMGCKKGTDPAVLEGFFLEQLETHHLTWEQVAWICSIDLKRQEEALVQLSARYRIPFRTFSPEQLKAAPGIYTPSAFVQQTTGVDNVCERSAMMYGGHLLVRKQAGNGVTFAVAEREITLVL